MQATVMVIASVVLLCAMPAAAEAEITLAGLKWKLEPALDGFSLESEEVFDDGRSREMLFAHSNGRSHLTMSISRAIPATSAVELRAEAWERIQAAPYKPTEVRFWESGDMALTQYFIETPIEGEPIHQKNLFCYYMRDGVVISLHASTAFFKKSDQEWMDALLQSLEPVPIDGKVP